MHMALMVLLMSTSMTIALLKSIFNTTRIIVDEDDNDGADAQNERHKLTLRLEELQTLIYQGIGHVPLINLSSFYDLLKHYHRYVFG